MTARTLLIYHPPFSTVYTHGHTVYMESRPMSHPRPQQAREDPDDDLHIERRLTRPPGKPIAPSANTESVAPTRMDGYDTMALVMTPLVAFITAHAEFPDQSSQHDK